MSYIVEEFCAPMTYDSPLQPEENWTSYGTYFGGKVWKTKHGAENAVAKLNRLTNNQYADRFRVREVN